MTAADPLRKLAVIFAIDAANYSRLMAQDERGTHDAVMRLRSEVLHTKITQHGGRVIKHTGDGLLAIFSSATDAMAGALDIQTALAARYAAEPGLKRIDFRIGIDIGEVMFEADNDIYGDDVNSAIRLEGLAPPGGVCISAKMHQQVRLKVPARYQDAGKHRIKNVPFPVHAFIVMPLDVRSARWPVFIRRIRRHVQRGIALAALLALAVGTWFVWNLDNSGPPITVAELTEIEKPSIAVLPFDYLGGDPTYRYLGDAIGDELITGLSHVAGLFVIARNSSFAFKGSRRRIQDIARELGVRYVIEGSVVIPMPVAGSKRPDRLKINIRLINGSTGQQIWGDAYNDRFDDILSVQERLSQKVIARISENLDLAPSSPLATTEEIALLRQKDTISADAYRAYLEGLAEYPKRNPAAYSRALSHFQKAVGLDPRFVRAHGALAAVYLDIHTIGWYRSPDLALYDLDRESSRVLAERHRRIAMASNFPPPIALRVTARMRTRQGRGRIEDALKAARQAVALSPNDAESHARLSLTQSWNGEGSAAVVSAETAMRLNPRFPPRYLSYHGIARFVAEDYAGAVDSLSRAVKGNPDNSLALVHLIAAHGQMMAVAKQKNNNAAQKRHGVAAGELIDTLNRLRGDLGLEPATYDLSFARERALYRFDADLRRFLAGLEEAGLN